MKRRLIAAALAALTAIAAGCGGGGGGSLPRSLRAPVVRAVDGDTILVRIAGHSEYVRLIGVDTPETVKPGAPVECFGPRASAYQHRLVEGRVVRLTFDRERRDAYGRLLAYVHVGRTFDNAALAARGLARPLPVAPNTAHAALFARLARRAAIAGRGLWGKC